MRRQHRHVFVDAAASRALYWLRARRARGGLARPRKRVAFPPKATSPLRHSEKSARGEGHADPCGTSARGVSKGSRPAIALREPGGNDSRARAAASG
jgi:hypothetical protein